MSETTERTRTMMSATCFTLPPRPVAQPSSPAAGRLEVIDQDTCVLHTGSNSLDELALYAALKGFDFQVLHPPELIPAVRALADRLGKAADTPHAR
jgi:hypothetical protein